MIYYMRNDSEENRQKFLVIKYYFYIYLYST